MIDFNAIVKGCVNNDRTCQEKLYKRFFPDMMTMCLKYAKDKDEGMVILNNGFLRVFKNIHQYAGTGSLEGWIRRIIYNAITDYFRANKNKVKFLVLEDYDKPYHQPILSKLYEKDLLSLIYKIPESSAKVFIMFVIHGYTHAEIAKQLKISIGTSKWHVAEARKKLQKLIYKQNEVIENVNY